MLIQDLINKDLISPPVWLPDNVMYLCRMGSDAYGVSSRNSDYDVYGFAIPPKTTVFPHLAGEIHGFGRKRDRFNVWQQHHVYDKESRREYDLSVYSIVKWFHLVMENNPNMIDSLFVPRRCVLHSTPIFEMVREKREIFLHKGCWHKFKGYAFQQMHKMKSKKPKYLSELMEFEKRHDISHSVSYEEAMRGDFSFFASGVWNPGNGENHTDIIDSYKSLYRKMVEAGKRSERCKIFGYDTKFAYHVVRLLGECEQILSSKTLELDEYGRRHHVKAVRDGEWSIKEIEEFFSTKEKHLEHLYHNSDLPHSPDEEAIKKLLLECLEQHYGSLDKAISSEDRAVQALREIADIIDKSKRIIQ